MFRFCAFFTLAFVCHVSQLDARQVDNPILDRVSADSAAVLILNHPVQLLDHFEYVDADESKYLARAVYAATCGEHPLLSSAQASELALLYDDLYELLSEIQEVVLVIHKFEDRSIPEISVILRITEGGLERLKLLWKRAVEVIGMEENSHGESGTTGGGSGSDALGLSSLIRKFQCTGTDELFIVSNSNEKFINQFYAKNRKGGKLTYSSSRRFKRLHAHFSNLDLGEPVLFGLGNPTKLKAFFPHISTNHWNALGVDNLPSFGCALFAKKSEESGQSANFVGEAYFTLTSPKTRISKYISAYQPFELIDVGFKPTYFRAESFDPIERNLSEKEVFNIEFPGKRFEDSKASKNKLDTRSYFDDRLPRTNLTYYFEKKKDDSLQNEVLQVEKVRDKEAMERWVLGLISIINKLRPEDEHIVPVPNDYGRLFSAHPESGENDYEEGMFLNDNWFASGDLRLIEQFLRAADGSVASTGNISRLVNKLNEDIAIAGEMVKVDFYAQGFFEQRASMIEGARIVEKYRGKRVDIAEIMKRKADEHGNTIQIESTDDAIAMIKRHLVDYVAEKYGNQIIVTSRDNDRFQLRVGIFPKAK